MGDDDNAARRRAGSAQQVRESSQTRSQAAPPAGVSLVGTVRNTVGNIAAPAWIVLTDPAGQQVARTRPDADGHYRLDGCPPGTYIAAVTSRHHQPVAERVLLRPGAPTHQDFVLEPEGRVSGTVRGPGEMRGLPYTAVTALDPHGQVVAYAMTDENGHYELPALSSGTYTLVAVGNPPATASASLHGGGSHTLDLTLRSPATTCATRDDHANTGRQR